MAKPIDSLTIHGFKSIKALDEFELRQLNVFIGANGAGKSNFVNIFSFLHELIEGRLALTVNKGSGADAFLFLGPRVTSKIAVKLRFGFNGYSFVLEPTSDNRLIFSDESVQYDGTGKTGPVSATLGSGHGESKVKEYALVRRDAKARFVYEAVSSWVAYHFHDTSETAGMRRTWTLRDNERLRPDGANLAAFLFRLKEDEPATYELICDAVRLVAPFFNDFQLKPKKAKGDEVVQLEWTQNNSDYPLHPGQFSDGTIRFAALATALLQPNPPATTLIDEPELGLHPYALNTLASLIRQGQKRTQLIVSTQSPVLLNAFEPEDIVVIDREKGESRFRRLSETDLSAWLEEEYSLGDLWQKEVYGGGPVHE